MKRGGVLLTLLIALGAFALGAAYRVYALVSTAPEEIKKTIEFDEQHGTLNILVLGIDDVEKVRRSDTIILARVDIDRKKATVMSIPRDTRITIKGHKQPQKINHAFAFGGVELLRDTVVNLTGVPVNYYLILNYASFPKIVDAVGGVDVNVTKRMKYVDNAQGLSIDFQPGKKHMNGEDALKYVRFRMDAMGDMGRMKRQLDFAQAFLNKLTTPAILPRIPEVVELTLSEIQTDIPVKTALQLAGQLKDIKLNDVRFFMMPGSPAYIGGVSYFVPNLQKTSEEMNPNIVQQRKETNAEGNESQRNAEDSLQESADKKDDVQTPSMSEEELLKLASQFKNPIAVLNGTGQPGLGKKFTSIFERAGIEVMFTGNAKHFDYRYSIIQYSDKGSLQMAKELAQLCDISEGLIRKANVAYPVALILGKNDNEKVMERLQLLLSKQKP